MATSDFKDHLSLIEIVDVPDGLTYIPNDPQIAVLIYKGVEVSLEALLFTEMFLLDDPASLSEERKELLRILTARKQTLETIERVCDQIIQAYHKENLEAEMEVTDSGFGFGAMN